MKPHLNLKNIKVDCNKISASKLKSIYVIEEDLDTNHLKSTDAQANSALDGKNSRVDKIQRYKYLCYLRSMDDMV